MTSKSVHLQSGRNTIYYAPAAPDLLFSCIGLAKDVQRRTRHADAVCESTLLATEEQIKALDGFSECDIFCARSVREGGVLSPYFLSEESMWRWVRESYAPSTLESITAVVNTLNLEWPELPKEHIVIFSTDNQGRLFTTISSHPELDGWLGSKKRFFPDRSWKTATEGTAAVRIVYEKSNYGFVVGEMVTGRAPALGDALTFLWDNAKMTDRMFAYTGKDGLIQYALKTTSALKKLYVYGARTEVYCEYMSDEETVWARGHKISDELIFVEQAKDIFGITRAKACALLDIADSLELHKYFTGVRPRVDVDFVAGFMRSNIPDNVATACEAGAFIPMCVAGLCDVQAFVCDIDKFDVLLNMTYEDCKDVLDFVSKCNKEADASLKAKVRKGHLKYRTYRY